MKMIEIAVLENDAHRNQKCNYNNLTNQIMK